MTASMGAGVHWSSCSDAGIWPSSESRGSRYVPLAMDTACRREGSRKRRGVGAGDRNERDVC